MTVDYPITWPIRVTYAVEILSLTKTDYTSTLSLAQARNLVCLMEKKRLKFLKNSFIICPLSYYCYCIQSVSQPV
jgi:hypothetical protein